MNVFFHEDGQVPLPKDEIRIEQVEIMPYPDRIRVFAHIRLSLFQERPNLMLSVRDATGKVVTEQMVIETMHHDMEFTLHLRGKSDTTGTYTFTVDLFYDSRNPPQDQRVETFVIPPVDPVDQDQTEANDAWCSG